jgi:hypothetical protein
MWSLGHESDVGGRHVLHPARIANQLNTDKVPTKRGGTWGGMTAKKILGRAA